jgi:hypothetical protein
VAADSEADLPALSSDHPGDGRPVLLPGAVPPDFVGPAAGRVERVAVTLPFLSRILIQFVRLGDLIL